MLAAIPPGNELQDRGISEWMGNLLRFHLSAPSLMCPSHRVVTPRLCPPPPAPCFPAQWRQPPLVEVWSA